MIGCVNSCWRQIIEDRLAYHKLLSASAAVTRIMKVSLVIRIFLIVRIRAVQCDMDYINNEVLATSEITSAKLERL